jgi:hypothetical protein
LGIKLGYLWYIRLPDDWMWHWFQLIWCWIYGYK